MDFDRRRFVSGGLGGGVMPLYPPWAGDRQEFERRCTRCHDCVTACPGDIIRISETGSPVVDFTLGECTFCGDCARQCEAKVLDPTSTHPAWPYRARVISGCLANEHIMCDSCRDNCPETAIVMRPNIGRPATPFIDDTLCSGCGACVRSCPSGAIRVQ